LISHFYFSNILKFYLLGRRRREGGEEVSKQLRSLGSIGWIDLWEKEVVNVLHIERLVGQKFRELP
jgi:hypothetical protein